MNIFWIFLYKGKYQDFLQKIKNPDMPILVFTPNPEIFVHAYHDKNFLHILQQATYNVPDGNGLYVAEEMKTGKNFFSSGIRLIFDKKNMVQKYGELIKGSDLTRDLFENAKNFSKKILVIDNYKIIEPQNAFEIEKKKIQENLPHLMKQFFSNIDVHILFDGEKNPEEIAQYIQKNAIEYVFSCIGMKKQEERLIQIFEKIPKNYGVLGLWVGASVDFLLGLQKRAPEIIRKTGMEWAYRLILEPKKRWKRIKRACIEFPNLIKQELWSHKNNNNH